MLWPDTASTLTCDVLYHEPRHAAGRAGNKGTAITFIAAEDDKFAPDLVKALKESAAPIPKDLQALADGFAEKRKAGTVQAHGTGYGGSGFKFDTTEEEERKAARKVCSPPHLMRPCPASWYLSCKLPIVWLLICRTRAT